ncbi:PHP domain-containing protein [Streptomyces sp. SAI-170]|uniref:PHP domain-containing protein n=1 Tax=Streptomyces sp. SAI-170 TaxID=3377729 RepID=UPI003C7C3307
MARAAERGFGTLALTDRDMVTGTVRFATAVADAGVKPVFGVDLGVAARTARAAGAPPHLGTRRRARRAGRLPCHVPGAGCGRVGPAVPDGVPPRTPRPSVPAPPSRHRGRCSPNARAGARWPRSARRRSRCGHSPPAVRDLARAAARTVRQAVGDG